MEISVLGAHTMFIFLALNKIELGYTQHDLSDTFLKIAAGGLSFGDLLNWILDHQV